MSENSIAFAFPGQGSQKVGMLADAHGRFEAVRQTFAEASQVLGYNMWDLSQRDKEPAYDPSQPGAGAPGAGAGPAGSPGGSPGAAAAGTAASGGTAGGDGGGGGGAALPNSDDPVEMAAAIRPSTSSAIAPTVPLLPASAAFHCAMRSSVAW